MTLRPRDFKSLVSTSFTTRAAMGAGARGAGGWGDCTGDGWQRGTSAGDQVRSLCDAPIAAAPRLSHQSMRFSRAL
jgi:hypothetical protein